MVVVEQGRTVLAAPWHSFSVTTEPVDPVVRSVVLVTVTSQPVPWPPTLSKPLHWFVIRVAAAADLIAEPVAGEATREKTAKRPKTTDAARATRLDLTGRGKAALSGASRIVSNSLRVKRLLW